MCLVVKIIIPFESEKEKISFSLSDKSEDRRRQKHEVPMIFTSSWDLIKF